MSTLYVDNLQPNLGSGVSIPGHVVQVVQSESSTETLTTSTSYVDTNLFATITPKSASSKILVNISAAFFIESTTTTLFELQSNITRNGASIKNFNRQIILRAAASGGFLGIGSHNTLIYLDSPASTSELTYRLQVASNTTDANARINKDNIAMSTITLMEIAQ